MTSRGSRTSTIVVAIGITVRQNGKSSEIRGSLNAISAPSRCRGSEHLIDDLRRSRPEGVEAGLLCPTGIEHRRLIPRSAEVSEQGLVEFHDRLDLEIADRVVRAGRHEPVGITE